MARTTTRARKTTAAKDAAATPAPQKTAAKKAPTAKAPTKRTPTKRTTPEQTPPTPTRTRRHTPSSDFITDAQIHGYHAARLAGIHTDHITDWRAHTDGTASHALNDGTLHYNHNTRTLTWQATCRMGAWHAYPIADRSGAAQARVAAAQCAIAHHDFSETKALTETEWAEIGIRRTPSWARTAPGTPATLAITVSVPKPAKPEEPTERTLADQLTHSDSSTVDTQRMNTAAIAAGLTARAAADSDQPKEHPQP